MKKIVVTGDALFLNRYKFLFTALSSYFERLDLIKIGEIYEPKIFNKFMKLVYCTTNGVSPKNADGYNKNNKAFIALSKKVEEKIYKLEHTPDFVFHVFGMCCPFWNKSTIPYGMYLDYTMALADRNYRPWAPFKTRKELELWLDCERKAYRDAKYLFTMSNVVKSSLIQDYDIEAEKITVVGSSGNCQESDRDRKTFGSKQILFNGSDFQRKGGELVLETFQKVRKILPDAKLVIIGKKLGINEEGVEDKGIITSPSVLRNLFLNSDLVLAPGICDPFPTFLLEAMNYGVPCVVSANDGMPEIVTHSKDGFVISQRNSHLFADTIVNLLCNNQTLEYMSANAKNKIKTRFNWDTIASIISEKIIK